MHLAIRERFQLNGARPYPGWTMVFVSSVCLASVFTASTATMPLLYGPVIDEFGWSRTQVTLLFTCKSIASALAALLLAGPICERFGLRCLSIGAFIVTAAGMTLFVWVDSLWTYYFAGIVLGIGVAGTFISSKLLVSRWFFRNQGFAIGVMLGGAAFGSLCYPIVFTLLEQALGWRAAFAALSLGVWLVALPLYLAKAKESPSDAEVLKETSQTHAAPSGSADSEPTREGFAALLQGQTFWLIAVSLLLAAAADAGLMQHTALYLERESGLATTTAAAAISGMLGLGFVAKAGAGWVFDRLSLKGIRIWYVLLALSIALTFSVTGTVTLIVFAFMRGIAHGGLMSEPAVVARHCYGPRLMNITVSTFVGLWAIGASLGPLLLSLLYDSQGTYRNGLILLIAAAILAAAALSRVRPAYRPNRHTEHQPRAS